MPQYQISGVNSEGVREVLKVEAESVVEAVFSVISEGYSEVTALTDDFFNAVGELPTTAKEEEHDEETVSLAERKTKFGWFLFSLTQSLTKHWLFYLVSFSWLAYRVSQGLYFRTGYSSYVWWAINWMGDVLLSFLCAFPFILALIYAAIRKNLDRFREVFEPLVTNETYMELVSESAWYRWDEAKALLPQLKGKIADFEYAVRESTILSGQGHFDEAVANLERFQDDPTVPDWMYHARFPEICYPSGRVDLILKHLKKANELAPDMDALRIDYATALVRFKRDILQAKKILSDVQEEGLAEIAKPYLHNVLGLIALEENDAACAMEHFEEALDVLSKYAEENPPAAGSVDVTHGYLCLAHAQAGKMEEAQEHFELAERRLRIFKLDDILKRCEGALAGGVDS